MRAGAQTRVDRLLANLGYGSRTEVRTLLTAGWVTLDDVAVGDGALKVRLDRDLCERMRVADEPLDPPAPLSLIVHKPLGVVCSHKDFGRSVYELLPQRWRRRSPALSSIGRLDLDTTGLLILTDDGALLHSLISPRRRVAKRYRAELERPLGGDEAVLFASGEMWLEGETTPLAPALLEPVTRVAVYLTITEGRYHQVRRMFAATGNRVTALHRDRIGALGLPDDLSPGEWRILDYREQALLLTA
ncbi:MAG TPA: 16S rRNA pseudouridine(516) synthase [Caulobacteraceae bacterium]